MAGLDRAIHVLHRVRKDVDGRVEAGHGMEPMTTTSGVIPLPAFAASLMPRSRLLALDLGATTLGLAIASWPNGIATPVTTIRRTRFQADAAALMDVIRRERITHLVLGLPLHMGGEEGRRAQATRAFVRNLQAFSPPPILLFDERLTTAEAGFTLHCGRITSSRLLKISNLTVIARSGATKQSRNNAR
jgi:putative holliday junction resolvase